MFTNNVSMAAEYVCCYLTSLKFLLLRQPNDCYEIAKRSYDFVMTYVGNRTINMTLVMLFLVGNNINSLHVLVIFTSNHSNSK